LLFTLFLIRLKPLQITDKRLIIRIVTQLYKGIKLTFSTHARIILYVQDHTIEWQIIQKLEIKYHNHKDC